MAGARLDVRRLVSRAAGSSEPWIAEASNGAQYVIKFRGAGPGAEALAAEHVVSRLSRRWGYPVPETRPIWLGADVPRAGTDEFWDVLDASVGWNLAVRFIERATSLELEPSMELEGDVRDALLVIDVLFENFDRTVLSRNAIRDGQGRVWLIDHGSCRFLHSLEQTSPAFELAPNHFLLGAELPSSIPHAVTVSELQRLIEDLPPEWLEALGIDLAKLVAGVSRRIESFARGGLTGES